jgi:hypothetical protein
MIIKQGTVGKATASQANRLWRLADWAARAYGGQEGATRSDGTSEETILLAADKSEESRGGQEDYNYALLAHFYYAIHTNYWSQCKKHRIYSFPSKNSIITALLLIDEVWVNTIYGNRWMERFRKYTGNLYPTGETGY